jgi:Ring finger domain
VIVLVPSKRHVNNKEAQSTPSLVAEAFQEPASSKSNLDLTTEPKDKAVEFKNTGEDAEEEEASEETTTTTDNIANHDATSKEPLDPTTPTARAISEPSRKETIITESDEDCDDNDDDDDDGIEPCSICLNEYRDGDEICWSHNESCNHFFHKECIQTWLLTHEDCPCCRRDFLCLFGDDGEEQGTNRNRSSSRNNYLPARSTSTLLGASSVRNNNANDNLDWASDLAEEINQRIIQRQRQLHAELERRGRELALQQLSLELAYTATPSLSSPAAANPQRHQVPRNTVVSVGDLASGLLLYRRFPWQYSSDRRRPSTRTAAARSQRNEDLEDDDDDDDIRVAHFGTREPTRGMEPWPVYPHIPSSSMVEMAEHTSHRYRQRPVDPGEPHHFSVAGREANPWLFPGSTAQYGSTIPWFFSGPTYPTHTPTRPSLRQSVEDSTSSRPTGARQSDQDNPDDGDDIVTASA